MTPEQDIHIPDSAEYPAGVPVDLDVRALERILEEDRASKRAVLRGERRPPATSKKPGVSNRATLNETLSERSGIQDIPLVQKGALEKEKTARLQEAFDVYWETIGWDSYDVRKKEARYAALYDSALQAMGALALNRLIRDYYEGVNQIAFKPMSDALARLRQIPEHAAKLNAFKPDRKKATSKFVAAKNVKGEWEFKRVANKGLTQVVVEQDVRSVERVYPPIPDNIVQMPEFQTYLRNQVELGLAENPDAGEMEIEAWFMSTTARKDQPGNNSPEGFHQDGYQLIGNMVIRRDAEIEGGESILYHRDAETGEMRELNREALKPGEFLDQRDMDTPLWHDVTRFQVRQNAPKDSYRRDILGSAVTILPRKEELHSSLNPQEQAIKQAFKALVATGDRYLLTANTQNDQTARQFYELAKAAYEKALVFQKANDLSDPEDFVRIIDSRGVRYALQNLEQAIAKIDAILTEIKTRGEFWARTTREKEAKTEAHMPFALALEKEYPKGYIIDERGFEVHDPSKGDIGYFEARLVEMLAEPDGEKRFAEAEAEIVPQLIRSLGRVPSPAEVLREYEHQAIFRQVEADAADSNSAYYKAEIEPQRRVIDSRTQDFPADASEFETAPARLEQIETERGRVERLIITTRNAIGNALVEHPVMTNEEVEWVHGSAEMITEHAGEGPVFIAGLGQGILNRKLQTLGTSRQIVAELNRNVIALPESQALMAQNPSLDVRQGDWRKVLRQAIDRGEKFKVVSIDAYPNSADEVNRDASSREALELGWQALEEGGVLTFYPDSRYIPLRVLKILDDMGIPRSSIHYQVAQFNTSKFTKSYHYGDLMAIPIIQKPVLNDAKRIAELESNYFRNRDHAIQEYTERQSHVPLAAVA